MEILILLGLIVLNGVFAMSEIALVTAKKSRLARRVEQGDKASQRALELSENPTNFLSTIQIGITSIGILNGIVGEATLAGPLSIWLEGQGLEGDSASIVATVLVVVSITYLSIVVGELVPKRLGQVSPEAIARLVATPMRVLGIVTKPFVRLLALSTELILRMVGPKINGDQAVTEEDIEALLEEGSSSGAIDRAEHDMVRNVFRLDDRQIGSLMIPRAAIVYLDVESAEDTLRLQLSEAEHSRFPVCVGGLDQILGIADAKSLLAQAVRGEPLNVRASLSPAVFVPETLTGRELLENFRASNIQFALVVDEYGEVQGLVTLQDVLEAITGEFKTESVEESWAFQREDGAWLLDGLIPLPELKDTLNIGQLPEEEKGRYQTLSGMVQLLLGRLPRLGDRIRWDGWVFEVVDLDGRRLDKVLAWAEPEANTIEARAKE